MVGPEASEIREINSGFLRVFFFGRFTLAGVDNRTSFIITNFDVDFMKDEPRFVSAIFVFLLRHQRVVIDAFQTK